MNLPKIALDELQFRRRAAGFTNARSAFGAFLEAITVRPDQCVLLPAYVGWTQREGSGVLDPVVRLGLRYRFYRMQPDLSIDIDDLTLRLESGGVAAAVFIHYFGRRDPLYAAAVERARAVEAAVLEDEAHAMLTDLVAGVSGRLGDAAIFSLHKLLPVAIGGALVVNGSPRWTDDALGKADSPLNALYEYDLAGIAEHRRSNAAAWAAAIERHPGLLRPLWPQFGAEADVPQTYPVLLCGHHRDAVFEQANAEGLGVVSLYHTLVSAITPEHHPDSHWISRHILNLPVHQGIDPDVIPGAAERLAEIAASFAK